MAGSGRLHRAARPARRRGAPVRGCAGGQGTMGRRARAGRGRPAGGSRHATGRARGRGPGGARGARRGSGGRGAAARGAPAAGQCRIVGHLGHLRRRGPAHRHDEVRQARPGGHRAATCRRCAREVLARAGGPADRGRRGGRRRWCDPGVRHLLRQHLLRPRGAVADPGGAVPGRLRFDRLLRALSERGGAIAAELGQLDQRREELLLG